MQDAGTADFVKAVDLRNVSARRRCYAPLRFSNHILAVSERDRARRAHGRARRFEISLQAVSAERAFVDLRREALVIVLRNNERTRLHARAAADAAGIVLDHRVRFYLRWFCCRCAHGPSFLLMVQRNNLVSGMCELAVPTLAVRSLPMSPGPIPA